jgi:HK97 family phage portal protein
MGVLNEIFTLKREGAATMVNPGGFFGFLNEISGTTANATSSLTIAAFFNGVEQISNDIAKLPKGVYVKTENSRQKDGESPINYLLNTAPNNLMTAFDFWKVIQISIILKGDGFAEIIRNQTSGLEEAYIFLDYKDVKVFKTDDKIFYNYKGRTISSENMLHFKGFSFDGIRGVSVIKFAAKQLGITLDAQNYASDVYKDRGIGYGVIESDKAIESTNKKAIEDGFATKMASKNKFKVPMLDEGMKYKNISITPEEAQFLETNKHAVLECCRWLNINPHKLKDLSAGTYSNVYQQSIEHVQDSILPWAIRMEQEVTRKSFEPGSNKYFKMNINSLLRGDLESKTKYYTSMVYAGLYTRNEIRALEEMNPIDGLDEILQPVNMQALSIAMELNKQNENGNSSK